MVTSKRVDNQGVQTQEFSALFRAGGYSGLSHPCGGHAVVELETTLSPDSWGWGNVISLLNAAMGLAITLIAGMAVTK